MMSNGWARFSEVSSTVECEHRERKNCDPCGLCHFVVTLTRACHKLNARERYSSVDLEEVLNVFARQCECSAVRIDRHSFELALVDTANRFTHRNRMPRRTRRKEVKL